MKTFLKLNFALSLLLAFGCSKKTDDMSHHTGSATQLLSDNVQWSFSEATEQALEQAAQAETSASDAIKPAQAKSKQDLVRMDKKARGEIADGIRNAIKPLENVALNPSFMNNSVLLRTNKFRQVFKKYSEGLSTLIRTDEEYVKNAGLLKAYWNAVSQGCDSNLEGCRALDIVLASSQTSGILETYAWELDEKIQKAGDLLAQSKIEKADHDEFRKKTIIEKMRVMRLALKAQNAGEDTKERLSLLFLASESQFKEVEGKSGNLENIRRQFINERITAQLYRKLNDEKFKEQILPYIRERGVWQQFTLRDLRSQKNNFGSLQVANELIKSSCRHFRSDESYRLAMKRSLEAVDSYGTTGFIKEINEMRASESSVILSNMRVNNSLSTNETLFILDQVYRGHWSMDIALSCWDASRAEISSAQARVEKDKELLKLAEDYIRIEMIKRVVATNNFMSKVFIPPPGKKKLSSKEVFERAIDESRELKPDWDELINRTTNVENFIKATVGDLPSNMQSDEYKKFKHMLLSVRSNIKLLAVYPNMLLLSYYLAAKNFSITLEGWFGQQFQLDAEMIINWIFGEGGEKTAARPLFDFGNDSRPIQTFENLYAFFYALKVNTFSTFATGDASTEDAAKEKPISEVNFFSEVTRRYINTEYLSLSNNIKSAEDSFNDDDKYKQFQRVCSATASGAKPGDYLLDMSLDNLRAQTFVSINAGDYSAIYRQLYGDTISGQLLSIRDTLFRKYLFINSMISLLDDHWSSQIEQLKSNPDLTKYKSVIASETEKASRLKEIRENFSPMHDIIRRYEQFAINNHRLVGDCMYVIHRQEIAQQNKLLQLENDFLQTVYSSFQELKQRVKADPSKEQELNQAYTDAVNGKSVENATDLMNKLIKLSAIYNEKPGDLDGFDEMKAATGYVYSRWNHLVRARNQLMSINPNIRITMPPILSEVGLYTSAKDSDARLAVAIHRIDSPADFTKTIFSGILKNQFNSWRANTSSLDLFKEKLLFMISMYKNQVLGVFSTARENCKSNPSSQSCLDKQIDRPIELNEIIAETFKIAGLVHITPEEEQQLRLLNLRTKFEKSDINEFFLDSREEPHSILEIPYKKLTGGQALMMQAKDAVVAFNALLSTGSNDQDEHVDWTKQTSKELMFLSEYDSVRKITKQVYNPIVTNSLKSSRTLESTIDCLAKSLTNKQRYRYLYEIDLKNPTPRSGKWIDIFPQGSSHAELLEGRLMDDFQNFVTEFEKDTKKVYWQSEDNKSVDCSNLAEQVK